MITKELLKKEQLILSHKIDKVNSFLCNAPKDYLICKMRGSSYCYYLREKKSEMHNNDVRLRSDAPLLLDMAKRNYYQQYIKDLQTMSEGIECCLKYYDKADFVDSYLEKHPGIQQIVQQALIDRKNKYMQWAAEPYERSTAFPEHLIYITYGGFYVRSKSEQMIANMYIEEGIPMRYEDPVTLPDGSIIYPDFHVYSLKDYKEYYHEHNGMMLNDEYFTNYMNKLWKLRRAGIVPGVNLLQTFESEGHPLNPASIREMIHVYLK